MKGRFSFPPLAKGFLVPNHTQTPNSLFDSALAEIKSYAELKVILTIIRYTFGWHKLKDKVSLSQIQRMTGLSRQGAQNGIDLALEHEYIEREPDGQAFIYGLKLVNEVDQSTNLTSPRGRQKPVKEVDRQLVKQVDTQKKREIKKEKEPSAHAVLMEYHQSHLKGKMSDGGAQASAAKWLLENYPMEEIKECYERLKNSWRDDVTLLTVRKMISQAVKVEVPRQGARTYEWMGRLYALDEVISDDGQRFTVMGPDGTPTRRWHTSEAFAQDKGITLEQAKYGMSA